IFPFFGRGAQANTFYFYNPKLVVQGQQKFLSTWGDRPNTDNWAIASAISSIREESRGVKEEKQTKNETFFVEKPENYVNALPQTKIEIDSIKKLNQNAYLQLGMIYKESFKNYPLAQDRLEHLLRLNLPGEIAASALYHLYKIDENGWPQKAKQYYNRIVQNHPDSPYAKILTNPDEFGQSDLQTPENVYESLFKIYQKGDFDQLEEKAKSFRVLLSGTAVQPKFDLLMANFQGRLKGRQQWQKELLNISQKYPESPEAIKALEMIGQIKGTDSIKKDNIIYLNYKWIFTFKVKDTASLRKIKNKLQDALEETPDSRWFLSEDRFDQNQTYLVLHGIRNRRKLNEWKKRFDGAEQEFSSTNNFVVLSADYKKMFLDKTQFTNEKQRD
ncbi:MAG: tetratricopeptide repeat protein, partial [Flavobacteriaceae bacterium]